MARRRVLFVAASYPSRDDPVASVFVREHARAVARFADVLVLHGPRCVGTEPWALVREEDPAVHDGVPAYLLTYSRSPVPGTSTAWSLWAAVRAVAQLGFSPDLVHAHIYKAGVAGAVLARRFGVPLVVTEHSSKFPRGLLSRRERIEARLAFAAAARVLPVSEALRRGIEAAGFAPRFEVVPNTVDPERFGLGAGGGGLLFVGSLLPVKGLDVLLGALGRQDARLTVIGDGPERAALRAQAAPLGERVRWLGKLPHAEVAAEMRRHDALVLPSRWENLPCVVIEALASGLPVVASDVGGVPELVDAKSGVLCAPESVAALAAALGELRARTFDRAAIRRRALDRWSHAAIARRFEAIYDAVLSPDAG